tara:strand:- start:95 stop:241 length:147 start_codon:yes stop_codon:yes gene_type:complete
MKDKNTFNDFLDLHCQDCKVENHSCCPLEDDNCPCCKQTLQNVRSDER